MLKKTIYTIAIACIGALAACDNQTDVYKDYIVPNGLVYPGPAQVPITHPGNQRIKISWLKGTDPRVQKAKIFWNNYTDSVEVSLNSNSDTVSHLIAPIPENTYSFMIHTYDNEGNRSIPVEVLGAVYGDNYRNLLINRLLKSAIYDGQDLKVSWGEPGSSEVRTQIQWTDSNGEIQNAMVAPSETETILPFFDYEKTLQYRTTYKPDSLAIDEFHATFVERLIDPEVLIPKAPWTSVVLPGDAGMNASYPLRLLWDGNTTNFMHSADPVTLPCTFTWDLGVKAKLSKMKLWPRNHNDDRWNRGHPSAFEIYGSLDPNPDGSLDESWIPLGKFKCVQPSGNGSATPWLAPTAADIALSNNGLDFEFVPGDSINPDTPVRYIRFRSLEHFNPSQPARILMAEISLWGTLVK
jgi:hypothetical protein